jgi:thioesterase domain-containing protein
LLLLDHEPDVFDGDVVMFSAARSRSAAVGSGIVSRWAHLRNRRAARSLLRSWRPYVSGEVAVVPVDCTHFEMFLPESLNAYAQHLTSLLETTAVASRDDALPCGTGIAANQHFTGMEP